MPNPARTPTWRPLLLALAASAVAGAIVVPLSPPTAVVAAVGAGLAAVLLWAVVRSPLAPLAVPMVVVGTVATAWYVRGEVARDQDVQRANVLAVAIGAVGVLLLALHAFALAADRRRARRVFGAVSLLVVVAAAVLLATGTVRFRGVTGNLVPRFEWGGERRVDFAAARAAPPADAASSRPPADAADFPQFQGPERSGRLAGPTLARAWPVEGPEPVWRRPVGAGWGGFAVVGRRAVTLEQRGEAETVACYDLVDGAPLWTYAVPGERYANPVAGIGPRTTPTIVDGSVYAAGATGLVHALDLATGALRWTVDVRARFAAAVPEWGFAGSPLVVGELVIVPAGGADAALVALDARDGRTRWQAGAAPVHWSSPRLATLGGVRQVLHFRGELAAHRLDDGALLWTWPWSGDLPRVAMPVPLDDGELLLSTGYGVGAERLAVRAADGSFAVESRWKNLALKSKFANPVVRDGHAYGLDDGRLACIDLADGARRWKVRGAGHGQLLLVDDLLVVTTEDGRVLLGPADPTGFVELASFRAFDHDTWNPPTLAGAWLLVRSDREAACYRLPLRTGDRPR